MTEIRMKQIFKKIKEIENKLTTSELIKDKESLDESEFFSDSFSSSDSASNTFKFPRKNSFYIPNENKVNPNHKFKKRNSLNSELYFDDRLSNMKIEKERLKKRFSHLGSLNSNSTPESIKKTLKRKNFKKTNLHNNRESYKNNVFETSISNFDYDDIGFSDTNDEKKTDNNNIKNNKNIELDIESIRFKNLKSTNIDGNKNNDTKKRERNSIYLNKNNDISNLNKENNENKLKYEPLEKNNIINNNTDLNTKAKNLDVYKDINLNKRRKSIVSNKSKRNNNNPEKSSIEDSSKNNRVKKLLKAFKEGFSNFFKFSKLEKEVNIPKNLVFNFGADLNETDKEGRNIIHRAFLQNNLELIENFFSEKKLDNKNIFDLSDKYGNTPLILVSKIPHNKQENLKRRILIEILIEKKVNLNKIENVNLWSACHWLCHNGDYVSLDILLRNGAAYFLPEIEGNFPIDIAGKLNHEKIVSKIINLLLNHLKRIGYKEDFNEYFIDDELKKIDNELKDYLYDLLVEFPKKNFINKKTKIKKRSKFENMDKKLILTKYQKFDIINKNQINSTDKEYVLFDNEIDGKDYRRKFNNKNGKDKNNFGENLINNCFSIDDSKEEFYDPNKENSFKDSNFSEDHDEENYIISFFDFDLMIVTIFLKILINHCLYWACYFKLNQYVINKLLDLGANPLVINCFYFYFFKIISL